MAHAQKPDSVFQRNGRVHLFRQGCQFSRVLAFLECGSGENDCSNTGWTVPSQAEDCWLSTPFASFPFISPPVRRCVVPDSVSTLPYIHCDSMWSYTTCDFCHMPMWVTCNAYCDRKYHTFTVTSICTNTTCDMSHARVGHLQCLL